MNQKLLVLACAGFVALAGCNREAPADPTTAPAATATADAAAAADAPQEPVLVSTDNRALDAGTLDLKGFAGSFEGTLPCADCPGLDARLQLNSDGSFELSETRQGQAAAGGGALDVVAADAGNMDGSWTAEAEGRRLRLDPNSKEAPDRVFEIVSNDEIRQLDADGSAAANGGSLRRAGPAS